MTSLLHSAVEAFHTGIAARTTQTASLDEVDEAAKGLHLAPLDASDRVTLRRISWYRERALSLARSGDLDEADKVMNATRVLISLAPFSANAQPYARTAFFAAASYLSYCRGEYARARGEMVDALRETNRIADLIGDTAALSARRVHLVHNVMKVDAASGAAGDVLRIGFPLLRYLAEGPGVWPPGCGPGPETRPDPHIAEYQSNRIVETIAEAAESHSGRECRAFCVETKRLADCRQPPSRRSWAWLRLKRWQFEGRAEEFLKGAASFLIAGPGAAPKLWFAVALDVLVLYWKHEPGEARKVTALMVNTMATSPGVPSFVRTGVEDWVAKGASSFTEEAGAPATGSTRTHPESCRPMSGRGLATSGRGGWRS